MDNLLYHLIFEKKPFTKDAGLKVRERKTIQETLSKGFKSKTLTDSLSDRLGRPLKTFKHLKADRTCCL
jgi:hypothetical protein